MVISPAPRRLLAVIALAVLLIAAAIPAVSATVLYDETIEYYEFTGGQTVLSKQSGSGTGSNAFNRFIIIDASKLHDLNYIGVDFTGKKSTLEPGITPITYTYNGIQKTGRVYTYYHKNILDQIIASQFIFYFDDWDNYGLSGQQTIQFSETLTTYLDSTKQPTITGDSPVISIHPYGDTYTITTSSGIDFKNQISIALEDADNVVVINLFRDVNGKKSRSILNVYDLDDNIILTDNSVDDIINFKLLARDISKIGIVAADKEYFYPITRETSIENPQVSIYIQNSQTGALLANAHLSILAAAGGTEVEILNTTLPGGTATYTLQPTGGGSPNPDYYRAVATVPGYTQIIDNHSFTLNGPHDVIIEMRPDSGGPLDPDKCYLEFYVRDLHANPIPSAAVQCDGRIQQTNSAGYAVFEVAKNASHPWIAKKSGYVTIEGTAVTGPNPRYVVNVVLGPGTVPTHTPTLGPGETPGGPGATPTPDTRTNEQKGQAIIDLIADFAEPIAILAILATIFGLMKMMTPGRR